MRTAIYGAGSLGTVLGAYLTKAGIDVELVNRNKLHTEAMKKNGAHITGTVDMTVPVKAIFPQEMKGTYDLIFLLTKQHNNRETATFLKPFLAPDGVICVMQNGIPEPSVADVVGKEHVLGCTVAWGATLGEPGTSELTSDPSELTFGMGSMTGEFTPAFNAVKAILENMGPVETEKDLAGVRWSKLLINASLSGIGTVIGGTFGDVLDKKKARSAALYVIKECIDVAHASGITFARMHGKDIVKLLYFTNPVKKIVAGILFRAALKKHKKLRASMLQDLEKGKPCEIDSLNGIICEYGKKHGIPTPFNDKIVEIIHRAQAGEMKLNYANISMFDGLG